jgi:hypothetical protein
LHGRVRDNKRTDRRNNEKREEGRFEMKRNRRKELGIMKF